MMEKRIGKRITITDLARITGFSKTTISHVVNNTKGARIRPETRELILKAAQEHHYVPNFFARNIIRGKTRYLGFLTHDLERAGRTGELVGAEEAVRAGGYRLMIATMGVGVAESEMILQLAQYGIEGLYADWLDDPREALDTLREFGIHLSLGEKIEDVEGIDCAYVNAEDGFRALGGRLKRLGHHFVSLLSTGSRADYRLAEAARLTLDAEGIEARIDTVERSDSKSDSVLRMPGSEGHPPTAYVCFDGVLALELLTRLLALGERVPRDVSVILAGGASGLGWEKPKLAVLALPERDRARKAFERLMERCEGKSVEELPPLTLSLKPEFSEGETLGPAPRHMPQAVIAV
ncbi:MAG: LacI family DNA-binding transcriptional regulator [Candidatus Sumerlaeota bacterium]|nr:LacI family DNA-binding transcriptional regulator [Candidatus Sumerlaeota bacterium]